MRTSSYKSKWLETLSDTCTVDSEATKNKDKPKPFVQPQGAHDAYMLDEVVLYNDQIFVSVMDNNVYSPDAYPQGWKIT